MRGVKYGEQGGLGPDGEGAWGLEALGRAVKGRGLQAGELPWLLRQGRPLSYKPGRALAWQDDSPALGLLIVAGRVDALKHRISGPAVGLHELGRGDWIGLAEAIASAPYQAEYRAICECHCLGYTASEIAALRARPALGAWLDLSLARVCLGLHSCLVGGDSRERLIAWLLSKRQALGDLERASLGLTQSEIARRLGLSRETVNRRLAELENAGYIELARSEIRVLDWDALKASLDA